MRRKIVLIIMVLVLTLFIGSTAKASWMEDPLDVPNLESYYDERDTEHLQTMLAAQIDYLIGKTIHTIHMVERIVFLKDDNQQSGQLDNQQLGQLLIHMVEQIVFLKDYSQQLGQLQSELVESNSQSACIDSDGDNFYVRGTVKCPNDLERTDFCAVRTTVPEFGEPMITDTCHLMPWESGYGCFLHEVIPEGGAQVVECPNGCNNGACF